jgi:hypothetical protein
MRIPKIPPEKILNSFRSQYSYLKKFGLKIDGLGDLMGENVISVSHPLIFDMRMLPKEFKGIVIRSGIHDIDLYDEFKISNNQKEYIWAYQRFELFVDKHVDEIRIKLENPELTRSEMLDAICFGNFAEHKCRCIEGETTGRIPKWEKG